MAASAQATRRVVITGMGVICPLGSTLEQVAEALAAGRSGVTPFASIPPQFLPMAFAGEVHDFRGEIQDFGSLEGDLKKAVRKGLKVMCRECQMGVAAAMRALADARLAAGAFDPERAGIVYGSDYMLSEPQEFNSGMRLCAESGSFDYARWGGDGMRQLTPLWLLKYLPNMPACHIAIYNDLRGPNNSLTLREASSNLAIGEALRTIQRGSADIMIAGATGTRIHPMKTVQIVQQEEVATNGVAPEEASRPFDRDRRGMVLGEGAGAVVLEELETARARGARIYAEVVGSGSSSAADRNFVALRETAMRNALKTTLADAGWRAVDVGHVHAHGLSTRSCDREEAAALKQFFTGPAEEIPVVSAKSYFGNLGAGGGAVELITSVLALGAGRLFPMRNFQHPDPECPIRVAEGTNTPAGRTFLNLNVTPQGQAACVAVQAFE